MHDSTPSSLPLRTAVRSTAKSDDVPTGDVIHAIVDYEDDYVQPIVLAALQSLIPQHRLRLLPTGIPNTSPDLPDNASKLLQIRAYESLDFDRALSYPDTSLVNSYVIRKALIRKHFLSATVDHWVAKHPGSILKGHVKRAEAFEVDYAEFLDDALVEAWDLRASLEKNDEGDGGGPGSEDSEDAQAQGCVRGDRSDERVAQGGTTVTGPRDPRERDWWILKPSMSDRGQGIRLFSTMGELQGIFDGWEADEPSSDDEDEELENGTDDDDDNDDDDDDVKDFITTSHLRHFVAQPYIHPPLLLPSCANRKFHIRAYVLCAGAMRVYVSREMLALFAGKPYSPPWENNTHSPSDDGGAYLDAHLTNTCLQGPDADATSVQRFWDLPDMSDALKDAVFGQVRDITGEVFEAAARGMTVHFQPLPFAFEAYGLDFLVDGTAENKVWLLEVNAFPDFRQTGDAGGLRDTVVGGFWRGAVRWGVGPWAGLGGEEEIGGHDTMVLVRDVDLGRR